MFENKPFRKLLLLPLIASVMVACSKEKEIAGPGHPKVEELNLLSGFKAEHLYSPGEEEQGSWVAMTFDDKGRMITADQYGALYRLQTPGLGAEDATPTVEKLVVGSDSSKLGMGYAQGLLYAFNSLYVMVNHNANDAFDKSTGMYRLQDTNGDDQYDQVTLIRSLEG